MSMIPINHNAVLPQKKVTNWWSRNRFLIPLILLRNRTRNQSQSSMWRSILRVNTCKFLHKFVDLSFCRPETRTPVENLIIETAFTGAIVVGMLITLAYLVYKRQKRFKSLEHELERKKTMQGQQKTKEQIHKSGMGSFLRSYTSATRQTGSSRSGS